MKIKLNIKSLRFLFIIVFWQSLIYSQTDSSYIKTEEVLEDILQEPIGEFDNSDLYEIIENLAANPINLNEADLDQLQQIPGMDFASAKLIIDHRKKYGNFFSVNELNSVQGLNQNLIKNAIAFLYVPTVEFITSETKEPGNIFGNIISETKLRFRSRFANDLQTREGFIKGKYDGNKSRIYNRLIVQNANGYQAGFLADKDAGESQLNEFTSYHFALNDIGIIHKAVVMDYLLEFGQGLTMWSPYAFSKGADAVYPIKRNDKLIKPYTSSTENNFFRGVAASIKLDKFLVSAFYSNNKFDANIDSLTGEITSTPVDGLHRTESEINKKNAATEKMIGGRLDYISGKIIKTGILYYQSDFSNSFAPSSVYDISGNKFNYTSIYYDAYFEKINLFGEIVYNGTSVASINGIQLVITRGFSFITSIRSYPRNFISLHGFAFGERSGATNNEVGVYAGFKWRSPIGLINFYYDQFKFPYATFSNPQPSGGDEFLVDYLAKPFSRLETRLRYKYENKDVTETLNNNKSIVKRLRQALRAELIYSITKKLRLKGRFEFSNYRIQATGENEKGYLLFQDIRFTPTNILNVYGRVIFFRTDSFNSAIYEYENNLTGVLTNLAMFGEGIRWYFLIRYRALRFLTLSFKYGETYKPKDKSISSGDNEIPGNVDNRIGFQLDVSL